jgi:PKD repeat protein
MINVRRRAGTMLAIASLIAGAVTAVGISSPAASAAPAPPSEAPAEVATADALPTAQIDGVAWSQTIVGDRVFVGGRFTTARPAGAAAGVNTVPRSNFMAYSLSTGVLDTAFQPAFNGQVKVVAASADGSRLYVGGDFTTVNGQPRNRFAAFDVTTGTLVANFAPDFNHVVDAIVVTPGAVYVGGDFTMVNGQWRIRLAAVSPVTGALSGWRPQADAVVLSMVLTPDNSKLVVGGSFEYLNTTSLAQGMGAVDPTTGAALPWNDGIISFGPKGGITSLRSDGTAIYANSYQYGPPPGTSVHQFEGTVSLNPATGAIIWMEDCHGDTYGSFATGNFVYAVGHAHYCQTVGGFPQLPGTSHQAAMAFSKAATGTLDANTQSGYKDWAGTPSPNIVGWFPYLQPGTFTGQGQAAWAITGNSQYVVLGGEFPAVNATGQQGLVRFAIPSKAPNKQGPRLSGTEFTPTAMALGSRVRVTIGANWDRDDMALSYQLIRDGDTARPVDSVTVSSLYWSLPTVVLVDGTAAAGTTHSYTVVAVDPNGNRATSAAVTATAGAALSNYAKAVLADGASRYWRLDEPSGTAVYDWVRASDAVSNTSVTRGAAGAISGDADTATTFSTTGSGLVRSNAQTSIAAADPFTIETWVETVSVTGGGIADFGNAASGSSSAIGRVLYMDGSGKIYFGVDNGTKRVISSPTGFRDGIYHHVVASLGSTGMRLYVDGTQVAASASVTTGTPMNGYWRLGGDALTGLPQAPAGSYLPATIDEFAVYDKALTAQQVAQHATAGGKNVPIPNADPVAAFTVSPSGLDAAVDGSSSHDSDGTIASYSWNWGDGTPAGSGATARHTYAAAGTYTITLTVTDNLGAQNSVSHLVTVAANAAPTASFTTATDGLTVSVNGSGSADSDGTIASYSWNWGDGAAAGSGVTATHAYAAAGSYAVTLTVKDNQGATGTKTLNVQVAPKTGPIAVDDFGRSVAGGWGSADTGGAWSLLGTASRFSVNGVTGRMSLATAGSSLAAYLPAGPSKNVDATVEVSMDKVPTVGAAYVAMDVRRVGTSNYRLKMRLAPDGTIQLITVAVVNNAETTLRTVTVPGVVYVVGDVLRLRFSVIGAGASSTLDGKVWKSGNAEPATWQISSSDSNAALQSPGGVGLWSYLGSTVGNAPLLVAFDKLAVTSSDQ